MPIIIYRREKVKLLGAPAETAAGAPRKTGDILPTGVILSLIEKLRAPCGMLPQGARPSPKVYHFPLSP